MSLFYFVCLRGCHSKILIIILDHITDFLETLHENRNWDLPYKFEHSSGMQIAHGPLPVNYTKLELHISSGHLVEDTERELLQEQDEEECQQASKDNNLADDLHDQSDEDSSDEQVTLLRDKTNG